MTTPETKSPRHAAPELARRHAVILHNDEVNSMDHVVDALLHSVPELSHHDAVSVMLEAHTKGRAVVTVRPLTTAQLYRDRLWSLGLEATVEPA